MSMLPFAAGKHLPARMLSSRPITASTRMALRRSASPSPPPARCATPPTSPCRRRCERRRWRGGCDRHHHRLARGLLAWLQGDDWKMIRDLLRHSPQFPRTRRMAEAVLVLNSGIRSCGRANPAARASPVRLGRREWLLRPRIGGMHSRASAAKGRRPSGYNPRPAGLRRQRQPGTGAAWYPLDWISSCRVLPALG